MATITAEKSKVAVIKPKSLMEITRQRFFKHPMALVGMFILLALVLYIVIGSFIFTEAQANFNDTGIRLQAPSQAHPFGTDGIGRDILARTIYGGQISLMIGVSSMLLSVFFGTLIGALSGFYGGWIDGILMRLTEMMLSVPRLLVLLVLSKAFGNQIPDVNILGRELDGTILLIILILGFTSWMGLARIVRSLFLSIKENEFILAARSIGVSDQGMILRHILPNAVAPIIVAATLDIAAAILTEAYISFLGLGVQEPTASWGNMMQEAQAQITRAWWMWFFPGLLIVLTVLGINFVGDGLRDALDPRSDKKA
jgi:peptide/nickel transport system permease protein